MITNFEQVVFVSSCGEEQSSISRNMGFRKINLVQEPIKDAPGEWTKKENKQLANHSHHFVLFI